MAGPPTLLDLLEQHAHEIKVGLGLKWPEFSRRAEEVASRFQAIAGQDQPAAGDLQDAINALLDICWDDACVAGLLDLGGKRPPSPQSPDVVEIKETANRYYSLLARLIETTDQTREKAHDLRTDT